MISFLKRIESFVIKHKTSILISIIILLGLGIRLKRLINFGDFWFDELVIADLARRPINQLFQLLHLENNPPLYPVIMHYWRLLFGESTFAMRFFSTLISMLTLIPIYQLGKYLFDKKTALISLTLLALAPYPIYIGTEARMYPLLLFFTACSILYFLKAVEKNEKKYWLLCLVALILACYTHLTALLIFPTFFAYLIIRKADKNRWLAAGVVAFASILAYFPWFFGFVCEKIDNYRQNLFATDWYTAMYFETSAILHVPTNLIFNGSFDSFNTNPLILLITSLLVIVPLVIMAINYKSENQHKKSIFDCLILLAIPLLISSLFNSSALRYYVINIPILIILLSYSLLISLNQLKYQKLKVLLVFFSLIIFIAGSVCLVKKNSGLSQFSDKLKEEGINYLLANPYSAIIKYYNPDIQINKITISDWGQKSDDEDYLAYVLKYNWNWNRYYWILKDKLIIEKKVSEVILNLPENFAYITNYPSPTDNQILLELNKVYCSRTFYANNSNELLIVYNKKPQNSECVPIEEILSN